MEVRFESGPGRPLALGAVHDGLDLELGVFDPSPRGPSFSVPGTDGALTTIWLPADTFDHPVARIDDVEVRTISHLAQYQIRAGLAITGAFGELRPKDIAAQRALRERSFADMSEVELQPRIDAS